MSLECHRVLVGAAAPFQGEKRCGDLAGSGDDYESAVGVRRDCVSFELHAGGQSVCAEVDLADESAALDEHRHDRAAARGQTQALKRSREAEVAKSIALFGRKPPRV